MTKYFSAPGLAFNLNIYKYDLKGSLLQILIVNTEFGFWRIEEDNISENN